MLPVWSGSNETCGLISGLEEKRIKAFSEDPICFAGLEMNGVPGFLPDTTPAVGLVAINSSDFAWNQSILVKSIHRTEPMIAVRNDDFSIN